MRMSRLHVLCLSSAICLGLPNVSAAITAADFLFRTTSVDGGNALALPYRIYVPSACASSRRCPVVLFLHGAGETGSNNTAQLNNRANDSFLVPEAANALNDPVIMVAPQTPEWWANDNPIAGTADVLDDVQREFGFDPARVYVTGLSMGGGGTLQFVSRFDAVAAAAAPICPAGIISSAADGNRLGSVPFWFFHASNDGTVTVNNSRTSVSTLRSAGGDPLYTEYASGGHGVWSQSYGIAKFVPWMLAQRWRLPMVATGPSVGLITPTAASRYYTNAGNLSATGVVAPADAQPSNVSYVFGAASGNAAGTTSFNTGPFTVPPNATTLLRVLAMGNSYVPSLGGNSTFSRSVLVTHPVPVNRAPNIALWIEPVARVGVPLRLRALVDDDGQPLATPRLSYRMVEGPVAANLQIDPANPALAWWTPTQPGLYRFELRASDGATAPSPTRITNGAKSVVTQSSVLVLANGAVRPTVSAVNAGGGNYTSPDGTLFNADIGFTGGASEVLNTGVTTIYGTEQDALYQSARRGDSFGYATPVANGRYLVVLHFSEWRAPSAVSRSVNVELEGSSALSAFDLYRWAGSRQAVRMGFVATVSDGVLNIAVRKTAGAVGDARLSGFEILSIPAARLGRNRRQP